MTDNIMINYEGLVREYIEGELGETATDEEIADLAIQLEEKVGEVDIDSLLWDKFYKLY